MSKTAQRLYEFGPFRLDTAERHLLRDGERVPLTPKAFELLVMLVQRSGHLIKKDELMESLWPDSIVEEANLTHHVWTLRKTLGGGREGQQYIENIPKRGYRFTASVRELVETDEELVLERHTLTRTIRVEEEQASNGHDTALEQASLPAGVEKQTWSRWRLGVAFGILCLLLMGAFAALYRPWSSRETKRAEVVGDVSPRSIAVLPFKMIGAGDDNEHLGLGMSDALITALGNVRQIIVRPTNAVRKYADSDQDPAVVGREQGVDAVVVGSVQRVDDRIRVTVQLVRALDGATLWAGRFDERLTDIFAVQDSIARQVTQGLMVKLSPDERERLQRHGSGNIEAYQAYLKGRYFWNKRNAEGFKKAVQYFNQAIEIDPAYARAYAGLADSYQFLGSYNVHSEKEAIPKARAAARKAIELDETLAEAHASLALILMNYDWNWAEAEKEYQRAIELNPNYATARHWYGEFLAWMGRFDEGLAEIKRAQELDPLSLIISTDVGKVYYLARQYDRAVEQFQKTLEMDGNFDHARGLLGLAYAQKGKYLEAVSEFHKIKDLENDPMYLSWLGLVYGTAGRGDEAREVLRRLSVLSKRTYVSPYSMMAVYTGLGEKNQAFEWFERVFEERASGPITLKVQPDFDRLRSDPRFADLLRRANFAS